MNYKILEDHEASTKLLEEHGVEATTVAEGVRHLIAEVSRLSENHPMHAMLRELDRVTRRCADDEVRFERARGPLVHLDESLLTIRRERGNTELCVVVDGRGYVRAELRFSGCRIGFEPAPSGASRALLWLGSLFAGEILPEAHER